MPAQGRAAFWQIGKESAYGGGATALGQGELISEGIEPDIGAIDDPSLYGGVSPRSLIEGGKTYKGPLVVRGNYEGYTQLELMRAIFGDYANTATYAGLGVAGTVSGSPLTTFTRGSGSNTTDGIVAGTPARGGGLPRGAYVVSVTSPTVLTLSAPATTGSQTITFNTYGDHTFTELGTLPSYQFNIQKGDPLGDGKVFSIVGAKIVPTATFRITAGQDAACMLQIETAVLGKDMSNNVTPATLYYPYISPILFHHAGQGGAGAAGLALDGTGDTAGSQRNRSLEVTYEQPHTLDRWYMGSKNIDEPLRERLTTTTWKITKEFNSLTDFNNAKTWKPAGSEMAPQFKMVSPVQFGGSAGISSYREFEIHSNKCQVVGWSAPVQGPSLVIATVTLRAFYDNVDDSSLLVRFRNGEPALP